MTSITNKVKQALHMDKNTTSTTHSTTTHGNNVPEGTTGPHNSRVANAADPKVDSDMDGSNRHTGTTHTGAGIGHSTHGHTTAGHSATGAGYGSTGPAPGTAGPHSSNLLNKADPTVDSDLSGGNHLGAQSDTRTAGYSGTGTTGTHTGAHTGTGVTGHSTTSHSTNAGPHNSNLLNKADPRVDSDMDGSNRHTGTTGTGITGHSTTGAGYGSSHTGTSHTTTAGPHSSNILNKADPRVDSDRSNTHGHSTTGAGAFSTPTTGTGTHGGISHSTNAGPHDSNFANKADPRVDSTLTGAGGHVGHSHGGITGASGSHATPGSGTAQNTAGPHNSDLLNKLDPRVDSDLSGGKTFGGNKTHQ